MIEKVVGGGGLFCSLVPRWIHPLPHLCGTLVFIKRKQVHHAKLLPAMFEGLMVAGLDAGRERGT